MDPERALTREKGLPHRPLRLGSPILRWPGEWRLKGREGKGAVAKKEGKEEIEGARENGW